MEAEDELEERCEVINSINVAWNVVVDVISILLCNQVLNEHNVAEASQNNNCEGKDVEPHDVKDLMSSLSDYVLHDVVDDKDEQKEVETKHDAYRCIHSHELGGLAYGNDRLRDIRLA